jgi:lysozyme
MKMIPPKGLEWPTPIEAVTLIADKEQGPKGGVATTAYLCPAGVWTIGLGRTQGVRRGMKCTERQGWEWLHEELVARTAQVLEVCKVEPSPNQLGALVSLQYNIGQGNFAGTGKRPKACTVLQRHNQGDFAAAGRAFALWNKATVNGTLQVLNGLTTRRAAEAALYLQPDDDEPPERMPQAVAAESSLFKSQISQGGAATVGTGALVALSGAKEHLGVVGSVIGEGKSLVVDTLGIPTGLLLPIVLVAAGGAILLWRYRQRKQGWA